MKLLEFTPVIPVGKPGDLSATLSIVRGAQHGVELTTTAAGIEIRNAKGLVLVPWSNVIQAVPAPEAKK